MRPKLLIFAILATVLGLLTIGVPYYRDSRIPRATAVIQIHPSMLTELYPNSTGILMTRSYMESEFETPLSAEVLERAAKEIISISPNNEKDVQDLTVISSATPRRGTDFIEITVKHKDRVFAVLTANALAEAYVNRRTENEQQQAEQALEALDEEIQKQAELVADLKAQVEQFRNKHGIDDALLEAYQGKRPLVGFENAQSPHVMKMTEALMESHPNTDLVGISLIQHNFSQFMEAHEQSRDMLREMKIKQQEERVLLKMPRNPVTIHERAK